MRRFTAKDKKSILNLLYGGMSKKSLANILGIEKKEITVWDLRFRQNGMDGLEPLRRRSYTEAFKQQVVSEYHNEGISTRQLCVRHNISLSTLKNWLRRYNAAPQS